MPYRTRRARRAGVEPEVVLQVNHAPRASRIKRSSLAPSAVPRHAQVFRHPLLAVPLVIIRELEPRTFLCRADVTGSPPPQDSMLELPERAFTRRVL